MAKELREISMAETFENTENRGGGQRSEFDDDGHEKRTGTWVTASAHIITGVIGSGVLSLAWALAQMGWIAGVLVLVLFGVITWFCSGLLADCYRSPHPVFGKRNYTYIHVVKTNLGGVKVALCGIAQYTNLAGVTIGYAITTGISAGAIQKSNCYHKHGHEAKCHQSLYQFMIAFGCAQIFLSQLQNFHKLWWLSYIAAAMSFGYSIIGLILSIIKIAGGGKVRTSLRGVTVGVDVTQSEKIWRILQSLGNIALAYNFSNILIEIQDTLKSSPPENQVMKKASAIGIATTTIFYMLCGVLGYTAFGNDAPGNFLTGFGFYEPYWLVDLGNIFVVVHLVGAYQVFAQPLYQFVESRARTRWPDSSFITSEHAVAVPLLGRCSFNLFRLIWRTAFVVFTVVAAMILPFFNAILGLLGALSFWPLTVYFPLEMHSAQTKLQKYSARWIWLKVLNYVCLLVSIAAACGSIQGIIQEVQTYKPFKNNL